MQPGRGHAAEHLQLVDRAGLYRCEEGHRGRGQQESWGGSRDRGRSGCWNWGWHWSRDRGWCGCRDRGRSWGWYGNRNRTGCRSL